MFRVLVTEGSVIAMQNRSPVLFIVGAALLFGGFQLLGGGGSTSGTAAMSSAPSNVSFEQATGMSSADIKRISKPSRDPNKEPWLVAPAKERVIAMLEDAAGVDVGRITKTTFSPPPLKSGEARDRKVRQMAVDFTKSGSLRRYRLTAIVEWTPQGWRLVEVVSPKARRS
ncbi:MAG: hypothetical protein AAF607_05190 [Pseudomonadota bacterium]